MTDRKQQQYGRSMIEMMGYIAVVMAFTVGIGHMISGAYGDYKFSKANMQITDLANSISKAGAIEENYSLIIDMINGTGEVTNTQKAEGLKLIPSSFRVKGRKIFHAFGGEVKIGIPASDDVSGTNYENKFYINFYNLNRNQCIDLAVKDWLKSKYADLYAIIINGTSGAAWYWPAYTTMTTTVPDEESESGEKEVSVGYTLPVKRSAVAGTSVTEDDGQCKDNNSNTIMWVFN
jgi:hypothetical protein